MPGMIGVSANMVSEWTSAGNHMIYVNYIM